MNKTIFAILCASTAVVTGCSAPDDFTEVDASEHLLTGTFVLEITHSGSCMDVEGVSANNGADIHQWSCHREANQQWVVTDLGNGYHTLRSVHSGRCLDIDAWGTHDGANVIQWDCHGGNNQQFQLLAQGDGSYQLKSRHSGKCLDVEGGYTSNGATIHQWSCHNGGNQRFRFTPTDDPSDPSGDPCSAPGLTWKTARKTHYTSYPDPGSDECIYYNGCQWAGYFAGCNGQQPESWVAATNIAAIFPSYGQYEHHNLCIRSGNKSMVVTVYDTCADSDCSGCCTQNQGSNDALIDLESYTNARWGLGDGIIEWADLGEAADPGCQ